MTKAIELREMSDEQLGLTIDEAADKLFRLRVQSQTEKLDSPSEIRRNRRLIARCKTIQTQREQAAAAKS
ncbi:50S ribosomal protein L29 [Botrimarina colliarenosi]|uniref:Large ribosomal subunit protein uL29 n=1 Tax=Botrimarina colliarenosi TaxID=2528001 RepID=A0A5C6AB38_9BACT|nr:50S ribosomal protein L29 [Botrimarina colliarenosi]TWT96656.1 50S ribosomal protein L29 [Botrimarina colliarenosi]